MAMTGSSGRNGTRASSWTDSSSRPRCRPLPGMMSSSESPRTISGGGWMKLNRGFKGHATGTCGARASVGCALCSIGYENVYSWLEFVAGLERLAPGVPFIPEIWQGHVNNGEGFWTALDRLEVWL